MSDEKESVREMLAAIRATQIAEKEGAAQYRNDLNARLDSYSKRIGHLERWRTMIHGAGLVAGTVGAIIWTKIQSNFHIGK